MKLLILDQSSFNTPITPITHWNPSIPCESLQTCTIIELQTHDIVAVKLKKGYEIVKHRQNRPQKFKTKKAFMSHIAKYM